MKQGETNLSVLLATDLDRHFQELVLTYQNRLYSFALRQTGSPQDAEDIVQEAFVQAYYALAGYSAERRHLLALQPWLYKITLNIFYSRMRQARLSVVPLDIKDEGPHAAKRFFRPLFSSERRGIQYKGASMQKTAFDDSYHAEHFAAKRLPSSSRQHGIRRNIAISFAVIVVLVNIVAWTVIAQKLRPSHSTQTGDNPGTITKPVAPTPSPTRKPISKNIGKTLYTFQCQMDYFHDMSWFPDSKRIATGCFGVQSWDATTGKNVSTYGTAATSNDCFLD